jgi:hypothetical protein
LHARLGIEHTAAGLRRSPAAATAGGTPSQPGIEQLAKRAPRAVEVGAECVRRAVHDRGGFGGVEAGPVHQEQCAALEARETLDEAKPQRAGEGRVLAAPRHHVRGRAGEEPPGTGPPVRFHRGLRNMTAALDLARSLHPAAKKVFLSGSSAGGSGVAAFAPSVFRFVFPPAAQLLAFNDAGPAVTNPARVGDVLARANDRQFEQFYPESCTECDAFNQPAEFVEWTLENDDGYTGSLYSTDGDAVIRFFIGIPTQEMYRDLLLGVHDTIHTGFPARYKRFIRSGDDSHTSLRGDRFYTGEANAVPLYRWTDDFVNGSPGWTDIVEDFTPIP